MPYQVSLLRNTFTDILPSSSSSPMKVGIKYSAFSGFFVTSFSKNSLKPSSSTSKKSGVSPTCSWKIVRGSDPNSRPSLLSNTELLSPLFDINHNIDLRFQYTLILACSQDLNIAFQFFSIIVIFRSISAFPFLTR